MKIAVVSIGNEILNGSIIDTNSNFIAKTLTFYGYDVCKILALSDDMKQISDTFEKLSMEYDIIITSGGLGPTFDDRTVESLAKASKTELKLNREIYFDIVKKVKSKGVKLKLSHLRQAYLPRDSKVINNDYGTAPGILKKYNRAYFILMPGVPSEMKPMFEKYVLHSIFEISHAEHKFRYDLKFIGIAESDMDEFLSNIDTKSIDIILNAQEGELAVRMFSHDKEKLEKLYNTISDAFGYKLYSKNDEKIEDVIDKILKTKKLKLGIIETFSGGYLSLLMSDKESFAKSVVIKDENVHIKPYIEEADITIFPHSLEKNNFKIDLSYKDKLNSTQAKYMGNINFMKKSVAKRTLGYLYEFLKKQS